MPMPVINEDNELVYIETKEVCCISKDPKTRRIIVTSNFGKFYLPSTIDQILLIMKSQGFARIESNRIVNVVQIKSFDGERVKVDGQEFYVSRRNRKTLAELIKKYREPFS